MTSDTSWNAKDVITVHTLADAFTSIKEHSSKPKRVFIIGGMQIYQQTLGIADRLEITHLDLIIDGDAFYPPITENFQKVKTTKTVDPKTLINCVFTTYQFKPISTVIEEINMENITL